MGMHRPRLHLPFEGRIPPHYAGGMNPLARWLCCLVALLFSAVVIAAQDSAAPSPGNRLAHLDGNNLFYPRRDFERLTTPQWIGEPDVEAVVILAIDDLRETAKYETFLRPILERLKRIDGRAPVSIMVNAQSPTNAQFQAWLAEGLSLEVHTLAHPCPCLAKGDIVAAAATYHGCVELMNLVPGNKPVAFRMPCCDSMNSPSPRFFSEIFNRTNTAGQFLTIDSSVMTLPTTNDASVPRELLVDASGRERFRKYFPTETNRTTRVSLKNFATTIEDYPYPYVIGRLGWEFPAMVPSDWEAFNVHGATNPVTLADWKAALDVTVLKQGVLTFIFHPHGWSSPEQFIEFIDHAVAKHGKKVKFLTFREAQERLDRNLLAGQPLRAADGGDNGVRLLDVNNDGFTDVLIGNDAVRRTRVWKPSSRQWKESALPVAFVQRAADGTRQDTGVRFGVLGEGGQAAMVLRNESTAGIWQFARSNWDASVISSDALMDENIFTARNGRDRGVRLLDVDADGRCELIVGNEQQNMVFAWSHAPRSWKKLEFQLPRGTAIVDAEGRDTGLRFVDVNTDGRLDVLVSNEREFSLHLFIPGANKRLMWEVGWNDEVWSAPRGSNALSAADIPAIVRAGAYRDNGAWFTRDTMWVQNEDTAHLPDKVDRRTFRELLTADDPPPLSPQESLAAMRPRPGFQVELVAAEPLVESPVAFDWGADGKLWVAEMNDYPMGLDGNGKPGGRIKFLEDTNSDGRYDKATLFLDGVNFPSGVMPWRNGVLVSAAPEIFLAEDTDGDGRADKRTTLYKGFTEGNQQHRLNGFEYGLDNWIYCANGDSGGTVLSTLKSDAPALSLRGRDFRFRPDDGGFESVPGTTQFGRRRDDWGNWFGNYNAAWLWHYHLPDHYLSRNPQLAVKSIRRDLAQYPDGTRLYPASRTRQRFNDHHHFNHVTSACSPAPYRDELFGEAFATSIFISDPVHNLVHREVLEPDGISFTSRRAGDEKDREFLASTDSWFRPTMLKTGPDGALYIADFHRIILEHPEWIPKFIQPRLDLRAGADRGRIYRVFPVGAKLRSPPRLDLLDTAGLVAALDSTNGWQRDTAQRLLVHKQDRAAVEPLKAMVKSSNNAKARLQALATLDGLSAVDEDVLLIVLKDAHPALRAQAIQLSEPLLRKKPGARLVAALHPMLGDKSARVQYQLAFTLGEWREPEAGQLLLELALHSFNDDAMQTAVMSSATPHLKTMLTTGHPSSPLIGYPHLFQKLLTLATLQDERETVCSVMIRELAGGNDSEERRFGALAAFLAGLDQRRLSMEQFAGNRAEFSALVPLVAKTTQAARNTAAEAKRDEAQRLAAIRLLGESIRANPEEARQLGALLRPQESVAVQRAAAMALGRGKENAVAEALLAAWRSASPALRQELLAALLSRPAWAKLLLSWVADGRVTATQLSTAQQQKLLRHSDSSIRESAGKVFAAAHGDRAALLAEYASAAKLRGDARHGLELFRQNCATCHKFRGEGFDVGPDLGSIADKSPQALLLSILDPNAAVEDRYVNYTATTASGREASGILLNETANSLTLRGPGGHEETLLRVDIRELTSSGISLMPDGFEKTMKPQDFADLIAALTTASR
jgi:putative membrane-bound dehydrogenase-like protein